MRVVWCALAILFVALGLVGAVLPLVPTVPFLIVAVWAAGKGWPQLEVWLINHPRYGTDIKAWRHHGVVRRRAKVLAITMMSLGYGFSWLMLPQLAILWKLVIGLILLTVAAWLASRPEAAPSA